MEPFLENGSMAGKILCPNQKCKAKIGNYDWAGVQCGCKDWVVPVSTGRVLSIPGSLIDHPVFCRDSASPETRSTRSGDLGVKD